MQYIYRRGRLREGRRKGNGEREEQEKEGEGRERKGETQFFSRKYMYFIQFGVQLQLNRHFNHFNPLKSISRKLNKGKKGGRLFYIVLTHFFWEPKHFKRNSVKCPNITSYSQEIKLYSTTTGIVLYLPNIKPWHWLSWSHPKSHFQNSHVSYK